MVDEKLSITASFNDDNENYFKIGVDDPENKKYILTLIKLLNNLKIAHLLNAEPEILSAKYKEWIGRHEFFRTNKYVIHIIFTEATIHLLIKCSLKQRENVIAALKKYCFFF